jgi:hypothetical protein
MPMTVRRWIIGKAAEYRDVLSIKRLFEFEIAYSHHKP